MNFYFLPSPNSLILLAAHLACLLIFFSTPIQDVLRSQQIKISFPSVSTIKNFAKINIFVKFRFGSRETSGRKGFDRMQKTF
jgi:hypothetical protein